MLQSYRLLAVSLVYLLCFGIGYPLYQFIFDDDGIGYMMVTKRLANGDFANGINGYWSPLHSWLMVPFYQWGINEFTAFKVSNGIFGLGVLIWVGRLLKKTDLGPRVKTILLFTCIPIILSYVFVEIGADLLFCWLLLVYIDLVTENCLFEKPGRNLLCGIVACLCYFAKAYAFPFFLVHFAVVQWLLYKKNKDVINRKKWLTRNLLLGIGSFLLLAAPWIYALYDKYHFFTIGYSGQLNIQAHLFAHQEIREPLVQPPPYPDSPCCWEDPWFYPSGVVPGQSFFSFDILLRMVRLFLTNSMRAISAFTEISFLSTAIVCCLVVYVVKKRTWLFTVFLLTIVLLPLGYMFVFIEIRYLWALTFLLLISGAVLVQQGWQLAGVQKRWQLAGWCIFFGSFLIYPINFLKDARGGGKEVFTLAEELREKGINGKFMIDASQDYSTIEKLAYLTGNQFYSLTRTNYSDGELLSAMHDKEINYFFFFYNTVKDLETFKNGLLYKAAVQPIHLDNRKLVILKIN